MLKTSLSLLLIIVISGFAETTLAQAVNPNVRSTELTIDGQTLKGHEINFDFTKKEIFKAWWRYTKEFSRNETKKDDIKHTIPPKEGESTVGVIYYSRVESPDSLTAKLIAAVSDNGMSSDDISKYIDQIKELLTEFRVDYYKNNLQKKIDHTEKSAARIGKQLDRFATERIRMEQKLQQTEEEKIEHQQAIIENDSLISSLTSRLASNRIKKDSVDNELDKIKLTLEELKEMIKGIR